MILQFICPIKITLPRVRTKDKTYMLNLNQYRNWHFLVNNAIKKAFCDYMDKMYPEAIKTQNRPIRIIYTIKYGTNRKLDFENIAVVVSKFFCDWAVGRKILIDDSTEYIKEIVYKWGGYEKGNYICYVEIEEI